jgi:hypothetical protein
VYDVFGALFATPDYRSCAYMSATGEAAPDSVEARAATKFRTWVRTLFLDRATDVRAAAQRLLADALDNPTRSSS